MPRPRHKRESAQRVFMISNVPGKERNELGKQIKKLGAVCASDATKFHAKVTHIVCGKLIRSEKFLGALALGSWVVRPEYVTASAVAKQWLDEVDYEWSSLEVGQSQVLAVAAKRNRWRASTTTEKIFNDWQVAVALSDVKRQQVYKRLLACGGARVCDVKLPVKDPLKYSDRLTYIFIDSNTVNLAQSLQDSGVICLNADYISDYLVMHPPPDLMNYLMQVNTDNQQPENSSHTTSSGSGSGLYLCSSTTIQNSATPGTNDDDEEDEKLVFSQTSSTTAPSSPAINRSSDYDDIEVLGFSQCPSSQSTAVINCVDDSVVEVCQQPVLREMTSCGVTVNGHMSPGNDSVIFISEEAGSSNKKMHRTKRACTIEDRTSAHFGSQPLHSTLQSGRQSKTSNSITISHTQTQNPIMAGVKDGTGIWHMPSTDKDMILSTSQSFQTVARAVGKQAASCPATRDGTVEQISLPLLDLQKTSQCPVVLGSSSKSSTSLTSTSAVATAAGSKTLCTLAASPLVAASSSALKLMAKENNKRGESDDFVTSSSFGPTTSTPVVSKPGISAAPISSITTKTRGKREHDSSAGVTVCDYKKEMKCLSDAVTASDTMHALVSFGKKVQTSLRGWFSPMGKENGSQGEVVKTKEVCAQPKVRRGLAAQFHTQSQHDRDVKMTLRDRHVLSQQKHLQDSSEVTVPKLPVEECRSLVQKPTPSEITEETVTEIASKTIVPKPVAEECAVADVIPKVHATECASKPSLSNLPNKKHTPDVILPTRPRTDAASDIDLFKPNTANVASFSDQNSPSPELHVSDSLLIERKTRPTLPKAAVADQTVLRQPGLMITEQDHPRSSSPDVVLSVRPVNNAWVSQRNKTQTNRMTSFMETVHRKRKSTDLEDSSGESSPAETEQETVLPRRPKTVRGLSQRLCLEQCPQKANSASGLTKKVHVSDLENKGKECVHILKPEGHSNYKGIDVKSSLPNEFFKHKALQHQTSLAPMRSVDAGSVHKYPGSEFLLKRKFHLVESSTGTQTNSLKAQVTLIRWGLSSVCLPGQAFTNSGTSTADDMGLRTIPDSISHIVSSCLDENEFQSAMSTVMAVVNSCPTAEVFKNVVTVLKKAEKTSQASQANAVLNAWLDQFPPVTSTLRTIYEQGLALNDWEVFRTILQNAIQEAETEAPDSNCAAGTRARLVLRLVVSVLERNFLHFAHNASRAGRCSCLLIRALWSPSYQVYPNGHTRDLLHFLETALRYLDTPQACWRELLTLVSMVIQCCHFVDNKWQWSVSGHVDRCSGPLVRELAQAITGGGIDGSTQLQQVLSCLSPPWLLQEVVAVLLEEYDDYLVPGGLTSDSITLKKIVSKYFFLLPKLSALNKRSIPAHLGVSALKVARATENLTLLLKIGAYATENENSSANTSPRKKIKKESKAKDENKVPPAGLTASKVNKKNSKGETLLHKAAMKNDISLLKQMLSVPGVDVNAQDFAGWTPLHEASNHGHVECVRALLKFVPSTTLHNFFQSGKQCKVQRVDLNLANEEGITPLHDAVMVNEISIVKLLLKYGGSSLLKAKTALGLLPVDLASTAEMRQVLSRDSFDLSFSQDSELFSQEIEGLEEREAVPSSFIYREVLEGDNGTTPFSASLEEARKLLTLLTLLLRSHMQVLIQERQQQPQHQQQRGTDDDGGMKWNSQFHADCLKRHMKKITTDEVFSSLTLQLAVLEALLMKSHT